MENAIDTSRPGEPKDPIDDYDSTHGKPCEEDVNAYPTNQPEFGDKSFKVGS
jgi:hypothetical protein